MNGPGKYDQECTVVRDLTDAQCVALIIAGGKNGSGFSVQTRDEQFVVMLPRLLREMADEIERGS